MYHRDPQISFHFEMCTITSSQTYCSYLQTEPCVRNTRVFAVRWKYFSHSCCPTYYSECDNWAAPAPPVLLPSPHSPQTTVDPTSSPSSATPAASYRLQRGTSLRPPCILLPLPLCSLHPPDEPIPLFAAGTARARSSPATDGEPKRRLPARLVLHQLALLPIYLYL
jgi:hypothetical protein